MFRVTKIQHYINVMQRWGFSADAVLSGSGITSTELGQSTYQVDLRQYQIVVANMMSLTGNDALGMEVGEEITFSDMDILGYAMMSASTIRRALGLWFAYSQPLFGSVLDVDLQDDKQCWHLSVTAFLPMSPVYRFCMEEFLTMSRYVGSNLSGQRVVYTNLELAYPQPKHHALYREKFSCPVQFNSERNRITGKSPALNALIQTNNPELNEMYLRFCEQMSGQLTGSTPLAVRVRNYFLKAPNRIPSIAEVAAQMNCSERSLRRHLKEEGTTYRQLVNKFRCDLAKEYLTTTHLSPAQIGFLLGYQDSKPFLRAFKSWTGQTIGEYRKEKGVN